MRNINQKSTLFLFVPVTIGLFFLFSQSGKSSQDSIIDFFRVIPKVVSTELLIIYLFSRFCWKWKIFRGWLVLFPDLNGTWKGKIQSTWENPKTKECPDLIPAILTIKQSFFNISCVMRTAEMTSHSVLSDFKLDKDNQIKRLIYTYDSNPLQTVRSRSPQHCGTIIFDIIEKPKLNLAGEYWTGRKTTGNIYMEYWKRELLDYYPENLGYHPVSEAKKNNAK